MQINLLPLGIMGWLTSCHMALTEGIEVLYGANTLEIRTETLQMDLGHYLPASHAKDVTSIRWILDHPRLRTMDCSVIIADRLPQLDRLLDVFPMAFSRVRTLYFGIHDRFTFWEHHESRTFKRQFQRYSRDVLPRMDKLALSFGERGVDLEIGLPSSTFFPLKTIGIAKGVKFQQPNVQVSSGMGSQGSYFTRSRIWRSLADVAVEGVGNAGAETMNSGERGYWISATTRDLPSDFFKNGRYARFRECGPVQGIATLEEAWNSN